MCADNKSEHSTDDDSEICDKTSNYHPLKSSREKEEKYRTKSLLAQICVTIAVMLSSASCGMPVGYSAILLPQLKFANDSMQIDDEIGSWIASVHSAASPFGSLLGGVLMDRCGRKLALQIASMPLILGWILIVFSGNHGVLLLGRLVAGISAGLSAASGQVLIGETSEPQWRGIFSSVPLASYSLGILIVYAFGSFLQWRYVAAVCAILPLTAILFFFLLPESPVWLTRHNRVEDAHKSLLWLRGGNHTQATTETEHLVERIKQEKLHESRTTLDVFGRPEFLKPYIIINVFNVLQIFSGTYLVVFYAVDILSHLKGHGFDHFIIAVITACVRLVFSIIASASLGVIGRRSLAMISGLGTTISALCIGILLYQDCSSNGLISACLILVYVATNTLGFMILPNVMLSELFPAKVRGLAGGLTFMKFGLILFGVAKLFPLIKSTIGIAGIFIIFGSSSLLASIFLYLMLPETKGQTLSQIEDYFKQDNIFWFQRNRKLIEKNKENETEKLAA